MASNYEKEIVQIALLAGDTAVIEDATFDGCHIKGPAVLAPVNTNFPGSTFNGPGRDAILWVVSPGRTEIIGAVGVIDCVFRGCTFTQVGICGPPESLDAFMARED